MKQHNSLYLHYCCTAITKRHFMACAGHPVDQTYSIFRMPSFKEVTNAEQLYQWMLTLLVKAKARGLKTFLPSLNRYHMETDLFELHECRQQVLELEKKLADASEMLARSNQKVRALEKESLQLAMASRTWFQRYQELTEEREESMDVLMTPKKKKLTKISCGLLELDI